MIKRHRQSGITLVQLLIGLFVGGIVMVGAGQLLITTSRTTQRITDRSTASSIGAKVKKSLDNISTLRFSATNGTAPGNIELANCLNRNAGLCTITSPDSQVSFEAMMPIANKTFRVAGTSTSDAPVYYTRAGLADCQTTGTASSDLAGCPAWRVNAFFWARCGQGEATCSEATVINVRFQVLPDSAIQASLRVGVDAPLKAWPPEPRFSTDRTSYAFPVRIRGGLLANQSCPGGTIATGYRANGEIECECAQGYRDDGDDPDTGQPICTEVATRCEDDERVVGLEVDGSPKCELVGTQEQCTVIEFVDATARCPAGWWLRSINMGQCTAGTNSKKSLQGQISCETNEGTCCHEVIP